MPHLLFSKKIVPTTHHIYFVCVLWGEYLICAPLLLFCTVIVGNYILFCLYLWKQPSGTGEFHHRSRQGFVDTRTGGWLWRLASSHGIFVPRPWTSGHYRCYVWAYQGNNKHVKNIWCWILRGNIFKAPGNLS